MDDAARTPALRLRAQALTGPRAAGAEQVLERLVGVQAQDLAFARLAFRPRCSSALTAADVDKALRERAVVWTWAMRGTLHLVRADDARWLVGLLGPIFAVRGRPRRLALGLDDDRCEQGIAVLRDVLGAEGPQTRDALAPRLPVDPAGQAAVHLLAYAAMRGVICRGPLAGREPTYVLLDEWIAPAPPAPAPPDALAELGRRYLAGHGPATAQDLATWSGIGLRRARRALEAAAPAMPARVRGRARPHVALLGHFDPYLLGYASRDLVLDGRHARRIQSGGGFVAPAVLVDGRVVGTWRRAGPDWLECFEPVAQDVRAALERDRCDVERFLAAGR